MKWNEEEEEIITPRFECFPHLPLELRRKIWKYSLPAPRILQQRFRWSRYDNILHDYIEPMDGCSTPRVVDTTLLNFQLICHEALQVFHEFYLKFELTGSSIASLWDPYAENERSDFGSVTITPQYSYFDKYHDTLFLTSSNISTLQSYNAWVDISQVRNLALSFGYASMEFRHQFGPHWEYIQGCPDLESLTFVIGADAPKDSGAYSYHLVNVDDDFHHLIIRDIKPKNTVSGDGSSDLERRIDRILQDCRDLESLFWGENPTDQRSFGLKIHLLGKQRHIQRQEQIVWLKPKDSNWSGISYFMKKPAPVPTRYFMRLGHLLCEAQCDHHGRLLTASSLVHLEHSDTDDARDENALDVEEVDAGLALLFLE